VAGVRVFICRQVCSKINSVTSVSFLRLCVTIHRMKIPLLLLFVFSLSLFVKTQNLVRNPGFELIAKIPSESDRGVHCAKHWRTPTFAGSDYYNVKGDKVAGVPHNAYGKQKPHSGAAYAGICIRSHYFEYLATTLTDTLKEGQDYIIEFYISRAEKSLGNVKEIGVLLTNKMKWRMDYEGISMRPGISFTNSKEYKNKKRWTKLSAIYHANGTETVIILGYFNYIHPNGRQQFCHYYIDDVSVRPADNNFEEVLKIEEKQGDQFVVSTAIVIDSLADVFLPTAGEPMVLQNVYFSSNASDLLPESFEELDKLAGYLEKNSTATIQISGHTDNTGTEDRNKNLSGERAKAVADYLILNGIDSSRVTYNGYGSSKPVSDNISGEGKRRNRRVEFVIYKK
jgi:OOP family OmpA-OmpF porin